MTAVPCVLIQAESSLSREASESGGAESEPSILTQGDASTSADQVAADEPQTEQVGVKLPLTCYTGHRSTCLQPTRHIQNKPSTRLYMLLPINYKNCNITCNHFIKHTVFRWLYYPPTSHWFLLISVYNENLAYSRNMIEIGN